MKRKRRARSVRSFWWRSGVEISDMRQKTKDFVLIKKLKILIIFLVLATHWWLGLRLSDPLVARFAT